MPKNGLQLLFHYYDYNILFKIMLHTFLIALKVF